MPYLVQVKTTPLRSPSLTAPPTAAARWGTRGERETTPPARPQAPEGHPGTLQGHQPKAKAKERTHAQRQRRVRRDGRDAPLPVAGRGGPRDAAGKASAECPLRHKDQRRREHHRGRAGFRTPSPSTHRHRARRVRGEGPAGRARRAVPFVKECPSLVWRGLGPARESATSPHRSSGGAKQAPRREGKMRRRQPAARKRAWPL